MFYNGCGCGQCGGYNYNTCNNQCGSNRGYAYALILVLFILLVIIGAAKA